jgi:site-specific DNA-methyltransferase (adenine-specific)
MQKVLATTQELRHKKRATRRANAAMALATTRGNLAMTDADHNDTSPTVQDHRDRGRPPPAQIGNATLYNADCLEILPSLPAASVDLILSDLPYGTTQNKWDSVIPLAPLWREYKRISRGAIVLTAAQPFSSQLVSSNIEMFRYEWIWAKNKASGHLNAKKRPLVAHESILVFSHDAPPYFPQKSSGHRPSNYAKRVTHTPNYGAQRSTTYGGGNTDRYPTSVLSFPVLNNDSPDRYHPTQKPVELMAYLIETYTRGGDTVLDNAMGSGTTGVACALLNRRFIGIERDSAYFPICLSRLRGEPVQVGVHTSQQAPSDQTTIFDWLGAAS